ncbi:hypothetical protein AMAG_13448 [Allomyces macrogynus ATCC 38327]|uniref:Response regulatory domain-containing protein n=1 Tax=Allomyces macrogynus (strain ATCC 38327) TaxID=578462 RepID=A0A0L0T1T4_ALLM3|nr:hypothetical protein AMAG_13448 [Allomyces macrogynus ATCC 38327]|eukprot:KNE68808.1 hypothetical protein AMAG_13448 [Allomyces macrogynus ATCC 38327]
MDRRPGSSRRPGFLGRITDNFYRTVHSSVAAAIPLLPRSHAAAPHSIPHVVTLAHVVPGLSAVTSTGDLAALAHDDADDNHPHHSHDGALLLPPPAPLSASSLPRESRSPSVRAAGSRSTRSSTPSPAPPSPPSPRRLDSGFAPLAADAAFVCAPCTTTREAAEHDEAKAAVAPVPLHANSDDADTYAKSLRGGWATPLGAARHDVPAARHPDYHLDNPHYPHDVRRPLVPNRDDDDDDDSDATATMAAVKGPAWLCAARNHWRSAWHDWTDQVASSSWAVRAGVLFVLVGWIAIAALVFRELRSILSTDEIRMRCEKSAQTLSFVFNKEVVGLMSNLFGLVGSLDSLSGPQLDQFMSLSLGNTSLLYSVGIFQHITSAQRGDWEAFANKSIFDLSNGNAVPAAQRNEYWPGTLTRFVDPSKTPNASPIIGSAFAFDPWGNPSRREVIGHGLKPNPSNPAPVAGRAVYQGPHPEFNVWHAVDNPVALPNNLSTQVMIGIAFQTTHIYDGWVADQECNYQLRDGKTVLENIFDGTEAADVHTAVMLPVLDRQWQLECRARPKYGNAMYKSWAYAVLVALLAAGPLIGLGTFHLLRRLQRERERHRELSYLEGLLCTLRAEAAACVQAIPCPTILVDDRGHVLAYNRRAGPLFAEYDPDWAKRDDEVIFLQAGVPPVTPAASSEAGVLDADIESGVSGYGMYHGPVRAFIQDDVAAPVRNPHLLAAGQRQVTVTRSDGTSFPADMAVSDFFPIERTAPVAEFAALAGHGGNASSSSAAPRLAQVVLLTDATEKVRVLAELEETKQRTERAHAVRAAILRLLCAALTAPLPVLFAHLEPAMVSAVSKGKCADPAAPPMWEAVHHMHRVVGEILFLVTRDAAALAPHLSRTAVQTLAPPVPRDAAAAAPGPLAAWLTAWLGTRRPQFDQRKHRVQYAVHPSAASVPEPLLAKPVLVKALDIAFALAAHESDVTVRVCARRRPVTVDPSCAQCGVRSAGPVKVLASGGPATTAAEWMLHVLIECAQVDAAVGHQLLVAPLAAGARQFTNATSAAHGAEFTSKYSWPVLRQVVAGAGGSVAAWEGPSSAVVAGAVYSGPHPGELVPASALEWVHVVLAIDVPIEDLQAVPVTGPPAGVKSVPPVVDWDALVDAAAEDEGAGTTAVPSPAAAVLEVVPLPASPPTALSSRVAVPPAAPAPGSPVLPPVASPVVASAAPRPPCLLRSLRQLPRNLPPAAAAAAAPQPAAPAAPAPGATAAPASPCHVLLVEDNLIVQRTTARMIAMGGHRVTTAGNGQIAVNLMADTAARATDPVHFIFMDLQMPVMDGTEAASIIATQLAPDVPIVAFTANATEDERVATMATGHFRACLFKPAKRDSLLKTVAQWTASSS